MWLNIFKHLLPNARAWRITVDKTLRQFFQGLTGIGADTKTFYDDIYNDLDPQKTRELSAWEVQFGLQDTGLNEQARRDRLDAAWKEKGGQDPRYIQDTLQAAGFDVYVHEWWEPSVEHPTGGSVNGDVTPTARNPFDYLDDGTGGLPFLMFDGGADAQDADSDSQDGGIVTISSQKQYVIPADPTKYPYFLYIGGATFPTQSQVSESRRDEFEDLCLKICPTEQWLGILVNYS